MWGHYTRFAQNQAWKVESIEYECWNSSGALPRPPIFWPETVDINRVAHLILKRQDPSFINSRDILEGESSKSEEVSTHHDCIVEHRSSRPLQCTFPHHDAWMETAFRCCDAKSSFLTSRAFNVYPTKHSCYSIQLTTRVFSPSAIPLSLSSGVRIIGTSTKQILTTKIVNTNTFQPFVNTPFQAILRLEILVRRLILPIIRCPQLADSTRHHHGRVWRQARAKLCWGGTETFRRDK